MSNGPPPCFSELFTEPDEITPLPLSPTHTLTHSHLITLFHAHSSPTLLCFSATISFVQLTGGFSDPPCTPINRLNTLPLWPLLSLCRFFIIFYLFCIFVVFFETHFGLTLVIYLLRFNPYSQSTFGFLHLCLHPTGTQIHLAPAPGYAD